MAWPISNRADSLTIDFHNLRRRVGAELGFGRSHSDWDDEQNAIVEDIIDEGVRQAYFPPPLMPPYTMVPIEAHSWTFLRPTWLFNTVSGQRRYVLPSDFERPIDAISHQDTDSGYLPLQQTSASRLRALENRTSNLTVPELFAIEPNTSTGESPQEQILVLHSTPDSDYRLAMQYQAWARRLTEDQPFPLGGQTFGPVILASCLAVAEMQVVGQQGPKYADFISKLAGVVIRDQQRAAATLGSSGGNFDGVFGRGTLRRLGGIWYNPLTVDGSSWQD